MNQNTIYITCLEFFFKNPIQGRNQGFSKQQLHDYHMTNHMANHMTNNMIVIKQRKAYNTTSFVTMVCVVCLLIFDW